MASLEMVHLEEIVSLKCSEKSTGGIKEVHVRHSCETQKHFTPRVDKQTHFVVCRSTALRPQTLPWGDWEFKVTAWFIIDTLCTVFRLKSKQNQKQQPITNKVLKCLFPLVAKFSKSKSHLETFMTTI